MQDTATKINSEVDKLLADKGLTREAVSSEFFVCTNPFCKDADEQFPASFCVHDPAKGLLCMACREPMAPFGETASAKGNGHIPAPDVVTPVNGTTSHKELFPPVTQYQAASDLTDDDIPINIAPSAIPVNGNGSASEPVLGRADRVDASYNSPGDDWASHLGEDYVTARMVGEVHPDDVPVFPAEMVTAIVKEHNNIKKQDVESVLAEFRSSVSIGQFAEDAFALVVTDVNDTAGMKMAREMRLTAKRERVKFDNEGLAKQDPYLRRLQIYQGIRKHGRELWQTIEDHLYKQENFEKIEKDRIAAELLPARLEDLKQFDWPAVTMPQKDIDTLKIGYMTEDDWLAFRSTVETEYLQKQEELRVAEEARKAEEERLERENLRLHKKNERVAELSKLGLIYDGEKFSRGPISIDLINVEGATDDSFARLLRNVKPQIDALADTELQAEQARLEAERKATAERELREKAEAELKRQADEKAAEEKRLAEEKAAEEARLAEIERLKQLAPEKEKLDTYLLEVQAVIEKQPIVESDEAKDLLSRFMGESADLVNKYATLAGKLGVTQ